MKIMLPVINSNGSLTSIDDGRIAQQVMEGEGRKEKRMESFSIFLLLSMGSWAVANKALNECGGANSSGLGSSQWATCHT